MRQLDQVQVRNALDTLNGWQGDSSAIHRDFAFADFSEAFAFLARVALISEKLNHHAEWSGVYNKVSLRLSTHDAGGVTEKDIRMAQSINQLLP